MVKRGNLNDTAIISVTGLKPNLDFDVFTVQRSSLDSSGASRERPSRASGWPGTSLIFSRTTMATPRSSSGRSCSTRFLALTLTDGDHDSTNAEQNTTVLKPTNTFHLGLLVQQSEGRTALC